MNNTIISIGRQFGSGGMIIGKLIAEQLGFKYYNKELILVAAKSVGFHPDVFTEVDEKKFFHRFFHRIGFFGNGFQMQSPLSEDSLFKVQSDAIRKISEESNCVIVGRCSDYILRENPNCVSIFLHANMEDRIKRICERKQVDEETAERLIEQTDKERAEYYNYFSSKTWGDAATYDLSVNVSSLGIENTAKFIVDFVVRRNHLI